MAEKTNGRKEQEKLIIDKIKSIFDNAEHIKRFHIDVNGGFGMITEIHYTVAENLVEEGEQNV